MNGWMDGWVGGWMDGWRAKRDCKIMSSFFILQSLNLSSYLQDQLFWSYLSLDLLLEPFQEKNVHYVI